MAELHQRTELDVRLKMAQLALEEINNGELLEHEAANKYPIDL
jgi:hypothetical protein